MSASDFIDFMIGFLDAADTSNLENEKVFKILLKHATVVIQNELVRGNFPPVLLLFWMALLITSEEGFQLENILMDHFAVSMDFFWDQGLHCLLGVYP